MAVLAQTLATKKQFFHWRLVFPEVFGDVTGQKLGTATCHPAPMGTAGFDVVLGNPPWEMVQHDPEEFFGTCEPAIAAAPNMDERRKMIEALRGANPSLYREFLHQQQISDACKKFIHFSGRFPRTGKGSINTAYVFAELETLLETLRNSNSSASGEHDIR